MRDAMKKTLAVLASVALIPTTALAVTIYAPHPGTVTATTYYSSGAFHGAVDISSGRCNYWGVESPVHNTFFWNVTIRNTNVFCSGGGSGNQNEAKHVFADGTTLRIWHFIKTADSYDRTCDRCQVGNEGGDFTGTHTHLQVDRNGTNDTSWYSGYTVKGEAVDRTEIIGVL